MNTSKKKTPEQIHESNLLRRRTWYQNNKEYVCIKSKERYIQKHDYIRQQRKDRYNDPTRYHIYMYDRAKQRARDRGLEFNISPEDIIIPDTCPVLWMRLERNCWWKTSAPNSPSLDRIDSSKGYIKWNVHVISHKANTIKTNATSEELISFAKWVLDFYK